MIDFRSNGVVRVHVGSYVSVGGLSEENERLLALAGHIPNPAYPRAVKERIFGVPREFVLSWFSRLSAGTDVVCVPRGMLNQVCEGLERLGYDWAIDDCRFEGELHPPPGVSFKSLGLRDYQVDAIEKMVRAEQGIYEAPTGSGKTMTAIGLIHKLGVPTVVIVDRNNLVQQWTARLLLSLGEPVREVCEGRANGWSDARVTVATIQTLVSPSSREHLLDIVSKSGMVIVDECHHVPAESYQKVLNLMPCRYRFGLSATPERQKGLLPVAEAFLGPIVARTDKEMLYKRGFLVKPTVVVPNTTFKFDYRPSGPGSDGKFRRNNWGDLVDALCHDGVRNLQISALISRYALSGRVQLVVSRRKEHLMAIKSAWAPAGAALWFTGDASQSERAEMLLDAERHAMAGTSVTMYSTLADEALDFPLFDTIHIVYPTSSSALLTQQVGRIVRPHASKGAPLIIDYFDHHVPILREQHYKRRREVYSPEGMTLVVP